MTLVEAWASGEHVGDARPVQRIDVRLGHFVHGYFPWDAPIDGADIYGESPRRPWQAVWTPRSDWRVLPGDESCDIEQDFDSQGIAVATISISTDVLTPVVGPNGAYHLIERGALSPFRGSPFDLPTRDPKYDVAPNDWYGYLTKNAQIKVWQGYGDDLEPTFTGMVDDVDVTSHPDHISLTARDFGQVLTDERVFGWVKSKQVPEPTIFRTTGKSKKDKGVGYDASASSHRAGYLPRFVVDDSSDSRWLSANHSTEDVTEWVQIRLPKGRYDSFAIHNAYPGMEVYVGVYARSDGLGAASCRLDGAAIADGWVEAGNGNVPGTEGGWPYLRRWGTMSDQGNAHKLKHSLEVGDGSVLRVGFRNLYRIDAGVYRAGVARLAAIKRAPIFTATKLGNRRKRIECEDVADVVKVVLRWAGFKEWRVAQTGAEIKGDWPFNRANSLREVIAKCEEITGYIFYMDPPTADDGSLGVPVFEPNYAIKNQAPQAVLTDDDLLTGLQAKASDEPLSSIIRIRGKGAKTGFTLGVDQVKKVMAVYRPPWARNKRLAGVIRHFIADSETIPALKRLTSNDECMVMAQLVALQMALQAYTGEVELPGHPGLNLNRQVQVFDRGSGLNTRLYIARRTSSFQTGENAAFKTTLGGALIDETDVQLVIRELQATLRRMGRPTDRVQIGDALMVEID